MYHVSDFVDWTELENRVDTQRELIYEQLDLLKTLQQPTSGWSHRA